MSIVNAVTASQPSTATVARRPAVSQASGQTPSEANASGVTISQAAKDLAAKENKIAPYPDVPESNMAHAKTPAQEKLIRGASSDTASAEKIAYDMAIAPSHIFYDISGQRGVGDGNGEFVRKLSTTGEIVDDNYVDRFKSEAAVIDAQRLAIYESEKAKGTDPLQILIKMLDFTNAQSQDYLEATGWGYMGSSPP